MFLRNLFGDANQRYLSKLQSVVDEINGLEKEYEVFSNSELKTKTGEFKERLNKSEVLNDLLPEAFALVREAAKRAIGQRHFDVQLLGGIILHQGKIAEMKTGEGKTLAATLPVYLNALKGKGAHVITVNDYLARRDTVWMGKIYDALGLTVGCINHDASYIYDSSHTPTSTPPIKEGETSTSVPPLNKGEAAAGGLDYFKVEHEFLRPVARKEAYQADITYGTNNEFGFDYLRDNLVRSQDQKAQKEHNFAIVDEVDSILIDEARTPLIISAPDTESTKLYQTFARVVPMLRENEDYNVDEKARSVMLTDKGIEKVENALGIANIYEHGGIKYVHHLEQALKAYILFKRDKDYIIKDGQIVIVDEFTGRLMSGRRWSEGLHQAVEAKEGVMVQKESKTLATITFQNYFRMYKKLSGMTGTAATSSEEFHKVYNLDVVVIPTDRPMIRVDMPDKIYKTKTAKWKAVVDEIREKHGVGQPVLVGTSSIENNELLSAMLRRVGVPHNVLNAKNHEGEGEIIAQAGRLGAVTVATNMAGRGVDIVLGGNPSDGGQNKAMAEKVKQLGGLHVASTERHEARRIDNQLRGRSGRQGDPGSSQFFVSLEDDVIRIFGGEKIKNLMETFGFPEDQPIEHRLISRAIEQAQGKIEGHNFDIRKYVLDFDDVMNKHRETIYNLRREIISQTDGELPTGGEFAAKFIEDSINEIVEKFVKLHTASYPWNIEEIYENITTLTNFKEDNLHSKLLDISKSEKADDLSNFLKEFLLKLYKKRKEERKEEFQKLEEAILFQIIDEFWMDHIEQMEYLRDSVGLRAYGQRDPLVEYRVEGHKMFQRLLESIKLQVVGLLFKLTSEGKQAKLAKQGSREVETKKPDVIATPAPFAKGAGQSNLKQGAKQQVQKKKVGRNDPCPCGSNKKYKKCCGK